MEGKGIQVQYIGKYHEWSTLSNVWPFNKKVLYKPNKTVSFHQGPKWKFNGSKVWNPFHFTMYVVHFLAYNEV